MRYQVPQFIEVEDKLFGPLSFKQFVYLVGTGGFVFLAFRMLPNFLALIISAPVAALGLSLAFYKINNKPFIFTLEAAVRYVLGSKLYVWKKETRAKKVEEALKRDRGEAIEVPKLSNSKLEDIAWGLDVKEKIEENGGEQ